MSLSLRSPALIRRRRARIARKIFFWLLIFLVIVVGPIWLAHADFMRISAVEVSGANSSLADEIKSLAEDSLSGKFFYLFPKNNSLIYPNREIESLILSDFIEVQSVELGLLSLKKLEIQVDLRKPSALWCKSKDARPCYYIDESGLVFEEAGDFSNGVYFIYYGRVENPVIGKAYIDGEKFLKIDQFKAGVRNLSLIPESISPLSEDSFTLRVSGGNIIFSLRDDVLATLTNLASVLADDTLSVVDDQVLQVSSIDLRFGNKVILKKN